MATGTDRQGNQLSNLQLRQQLGNAANITQTVTLAFTDPVQDLRFTLLDIDSSNTGNILYDQVAVTSGFNTPTLPGGMTGNGTAGTPFKQSGANTIAVGTAVNGNVPLVYPGPISSVSVTFSSGVDTSSTATPLFYPIIALSNLAFTRGGC